MLNVQQGALIAGPARPPPMVVVAQRVLGFFFNIVQYRLLTDPFVRARRVGQKGMKGLVQVENRFAQLRALAPVAEAQPVKCGRCWGPFPGSPLEPRAYGARASASSRL